MFSAVDLLNLGRRDDTSHRTSNGNSHRTSSSHPTLWRQSTRTKPGPCILYKLVSYRYYELRKYTYAILKAEPWTVKSYDTNIYPSKYNRIIPLRKSRTYLERAPGHRCCHCKHLSLHKLRKDNFAKTFNITKVISVENETVIN